MLEHINEYISSRRLKKGTVAHYSMWLGRLDRACGGKGISEVTLGDLSGFFDAYSDSHSPKTVELAFDIFKAFFRFWHGEVECLNPSRISVPRTRARSHHSITDAEHLLMMATLDRSNFRDLQRALVLSILRDTGMRIGELVSLRLDSIDRMSATVETEKTVRSRKVFWGDETQSILNRYLPVVWEIPRARFLMVGLYANGRISPSMTTRSVENIVTKCAARAGLSGIVPHGYRHARIRRWFDSGLSPHQIILMSGHESTVSLEHYMRLGTAEVERLARRHM